MGHGVSYCVVWTPRYPYSTRDSYGTMEGWDIAHTLVPSDTVLESYGIPRHLLGYRASFMGYEQMIAKLDVTDYFTTVE